MPPPAKPKAAAKPLKASARDVVRPKKLYRKDDAMADKENKGTGPPATVRRELQKKAIAAGIKANGKSSEIQEALIRLEEAASRGLDNYLQPIDIKNRWQAASDPKEAEREELADLAFLGIKGKTPGGSRWRTRVTGKERVTSMAALAEVEEIHI